MVKFTVSRDGKVLIGIGLSADNIRRLQAGQPIKAKLDDLGLEETEIFILAGETEEKLVQFLKKLDF